MEQRITEAEAAANLAAKPTIQDIAGIPHLLYPNGLGEFGHVSFETLMSNPRRKMGSIVLHEVESFIEAAKKHGTPETSVVYLDVDYGANKVSATAVFNDHGSDKAGWLDHRATFTPRNSVEWKRWLEKNKAVMSQIELANFLEANIGDITGGDKLPSGSDVLTFVSTLEEVRTVKYGSAVNLQNGMVRLEFVEDGNDATKKNLELFREFAIGVSPFFGGTGYEVRAFLRYRINRNSGEITFWYELQRADKVLEDACKDLITKIKDETGLPVLYGAAPSYSSTVERQR